MQLASLAQFRRLAQGIGAFYEILCTIGEINSSHIPILAHLIGGGYHYYQKRFHLAFVQGIKNLDGP